jgi:hypothetical protein
MLYRGINPRFAPRLSTACAFCAPEILTIPPALIFLRRGDASRLVDPRFLERAVRRVVLNGPSHEAAVTFGVAPICSVICSAK